MARLQTRVSPTVLFAGLFITSIILLLTPAQFTNKFHFAFIRIFEKFLSISANPSTAANPAVNPANSRDFVPRTEYTKLLTAYNNLHADLREEHLKLEKLAGLRLSFPQPGQALLPAEVISTSAVSGGKLIINRGADDSIEKGQYVLGSNNSIIGTISESVSSHTAEVRLITDSSHKILVEIAANKQAAWIRGIMQGDGKKYGKISLISKQYRINTGDSVYAAKNKGFLETPRLIGTVAQCRENDTNPMLWNIIVKPICDFEKLQEIVVIISNKPAGKTK